MKCVTVLDKQSILFVNEDLLTNSDWNVGISVIQFSNWVFLFNKETKWDQQYFKWNSICAEMFDNHAQLKWSNNEWLLFLNKSIEGFVKWLTPNNKTRRHWSLPTGVMI